MTRRRTHVLVAAVSAAVLGAAVGYVHHRGSSTGAPPGWPTSTSEAPVVVLVPDERGGAAVLARAVVDRPYGAVRAAVTDYALFSEIFASSLWKLELATGWVDSKQVRLSGRMALWLHDVPIDIVVHHRGDDAAFEASWDSNPAMVGRVNRGRWRIERAGPNLTRLSWRLSVNEPPYPNAWVNNALLEVAGPTVEAIRRWVRR